MNIVARTMFAYFRFTGSEREAIKKNGLHSNFSFLHIGDIIKMLNVKNVIFETLNTFTTADPLM